MIFLLYCVLQSIEACLFYKGAFTIRAYILQVTSLPYRIGLVFYALSHESSDKYTLSQLLHVLSYVLYVFPVVQFTTNNLIMQVISRHFPKIEAQKDELKIDIFILLMLDTLLCSIPVVPLCGLDLLNHEIDNLCSSMHT